MGLVIALVAMMAIIDIASGLKLVHSGIDSL
jgi:hypothetical protein